MNNKPIYRQELSLPDDFEFEVLWVQPTWEHSDNDLNTLHFHNVIEVDYIVDGEGTNFFTEGIQMIQPDDIYVINAFENHSTYSCGSLRLACIHFNPHTVVDSCFTDMDYIKAVKAGNFNFKNLLRAGDEKVKNIKSVIINILKEWEEKKEGYKPIIRLMLAKLLLLLNRDFRVDPRPQSKNKSNQIMYERVREVLDYIHTNLGSNMCLDDLSQKAHMHKTYFSAFFKKATGYAPMQYVNNLKISKACSLLKTSDMYINEISEKSGFNTVSNFNKAFKKAMAMTPHEFRWNGYIG